MAENGRRETAASTVRAGSLHCPSSGIRLISSTSRLRLEADEWEVTVLGSKLDAVLEEEVKVEDRQRLFRTYIWIKFPCTCLRVSAEVAVVVAAAASEAEERCFPGSAVVS